jgi:hypothetical protein
MAELWIMVRAEIQPNDESADRFAPNPLAAKTVLSMYKADLPGYGLSITSDCYLARDIGGTKTGLVLFWAVCHGFEQLETRSEGEGCYFTMIHT